MDLLVFVGVLVVLAVASYLFGSDSRDWERGSGLFEVDVYEMEMRSRRAAFERRAVRVAPLPPPRPPRRAVVAPALAWVGSRLVSWGTALQRRYALPSVGGAEPAFGP